MRVSPGTRLGRYEVLNHLATGGMGEVYRALDTHLDRYVALKTIGERFAPDPTSQPRFERERRVVTSLEHPHICTVLDAGREQGVEYFAMELLNGESLARRLERGAIPLEEALGYAIEIADAVCYAHDHGVIHRDLKPANVFLTPTGAKVLDFGLAKVRGTVVRNAALFQDTAPLDVSQPGAVIGSTPYLPPERLDGVDADTRSDIFAFGAVVYEMVSGRRAFPGDSDAATIAALMSADPAPIDLPHPKAGDLEWIIRGCLAKSPERRWQAMADVRMLLKRVAGHSVGQPPPRQRRIRYFAAAALGAALTALAAWALVEPQRPARVALSIVPPAGAVFTPTAGSVTSPQFALSPDNRAVAFVASGADGVACLWVRQFASLAATRLNGTEGASFPFWAPGGTALGYFSNGTIRRIDLSGGPSRPLADAANGRGASWSEDGKILFASGTQSGLHVVSAEGGPSSPVTQPDPSRGESGQRWPQFLQDGRHFIFFSRAGVGHESEEGIYFGSLDGEKPRLVIRSSAGAVFVAPDRLLFVSEGTLLSRAFDVTSGHVSGDPVVIAENVAVSSNYYGAFSASRNGTIAFAPAAMTSDLVLTRRDGTIDRTVGSSGRYVDFRLSPDGHSLAVAEVGRDSSFADIFLVDLARGGVRTNRIASSRATDASPVWSPDGRRVVFRSNRQAAHDLYLAPAGGAGLESQFQTSSSGKYPTSWSADGTIVFHTTRGDSYDIMIAKADGSGDVRAVLNSPFDEVQGQISPDGKWLAYTANDTGSFQVYVRPLLGGDRVPVSVAGGLDPHWRASGDELFYIDMATQRLTTVSVSRKGQHLEVGSPRSLFEVRSAMLSAPYTSTYDVAPDGEHFLVRTLREDVRTTPLAVLLNWPLNGHR